MTDTANKALLPTGLRDVLPPDAALEATAIDALTSAFAAHGYQRVKPPLIEFEESLLSDAGQATAHSTFRVMDPVSQRMMGLRADITTQVARIATTRLSSQPRPLRLCYAGQVLQVKGSQLRPERQFTQVGIELFGAQTPYADAEVIGLLLDALQRAGVDVGAVSVDLTLPTLVPAICDDLGVDPAQRKILREALDQKDAATVRSMGGEVAEIFGSLLACCGPAEAVLDRLAALPFPADAAQRCARLAEVVALVRQSHPQTSLTVDAVENRGFEYHTGVAFSLFARSVRGELGRGGRYRAGQDQERAVGATLFVDAVTQAMAAPEPAKRVFLSTADRLLAPRLQNEGWVTVAALSGDVDGAAEARRLGCSHYSDGGNLFAVTDN
jgi:ATP phosphoribosyltransferase regulatory subunit